MSIANLATAQLPQPEERPGPTTPAERNPVLDILRGFALFGILLVNFPGSDASSAGAADNIVSKFLSLFVSGKFYTTFSFLFGLGFSLLLVRAQARKSPIIGLYLRRLFLLFLFGLAHYVFLWRGDVLMVYAVSGLLLLLVHKLPVRLLPWVAALVLAGDVYLMTSDRPFLVSNLVPRRVNPELEQQRERDNAIAFNTLREAGSRLNVAVRTGSYPEVVRARAEVWLLSNRYAFRYLWFTSLVMFLLGLYAGRRGWFAGPPVRSRARKRLLWTMLPIWLVLGSFMTFGSELMPGLFHRFHWKVLGPLWTVSEVAGSLSYICAILTLLAWRPDWIRRLAPLGAVGRMGLTNYLLQSVIGTTLYYAYGLNLQVHLGNLSGLLLGVTVFLLQIPLSMWWLRRFRFGPCEWLWRSGTYLRIQPMR